MFPGVCTCRLGEAASWSSSGVIESQCEVTTFLIVILTIPDDAVRFMDFFSKNIIHLTSSIFHHPSSIIHHTSSIIHLPSSGFSQQLDDSFYLSGRKRLAGGFVARRLQLLPELGAAANPTHQVAHGRARAAVWEVHQRQFLFAICTNDKVIHTNYQLSIVNYQFDL